MTTSAPEEMHDSAVPDSGGAGSTPEAPAADLAAWLDVLDERLGDGVDGGSLLPLTDGALAVPGFSCDDLKGISRTETAETVRRSLALALWIDDVLASLDAQNEPERLADAARACVLVTSELDGRVDDAVFHGDLRVGRGLARVKEKLAALALRLRGTIAEAKRLEQEELQREAERSRIRSEASMSAALRVPAGAPAPAPRGARRPRGEKLPASRTSATSVTYAQPRSEAASGGATMLIPGLVLAAAALLIGRAVLVLSAQPVNAGPAVTATLGSSAEGVGDLCAVGDVLTGTADASWDALDRPQAVRRFEALRDAAGREGFRSVYLVDATGAERARWTDGRATVVRRAPSTRSDREPLKTTRFESRTVRAAAPGGDAAADPLPFPNR